MHDAPRKKAKKTKPKKPQYVIWWKPNGGRRVEYGPIYEKKVAKRDAAFLENAHGEGNAGWELYEPNRGRRDDRPPRGRRYD